MPYADSQGIRIHYQIEGAGSPVVLQHGMTQSIEDWYERGYVDALRGTHSLILIDARGHGRSDKPHETRAYSLASRVNDVVAVLDAEGTEKADFWGYSMGGWIGFGMAKFAPRRVNRLVIGGAHPYPRSMEGFRQVIMTALAEGHGPFVALVERWYPLPPGYEARLREADLEALLALAQDREDLEPVLATIARPCCLYAGQADEMFAQAEQASRLIAGATFFALPGLGHGQAFVRSDLVGPQVTRFLQRAA